MLNSSIIFYLIPVSAFVLVASLTVVGCRVQVDKPEGESPNGVKLDPTLPKDSRLFELFESIPVIDYTKEPNYTKCTYNDYELNGETGEFSTEPKPNASVSTYSYDSKGRKTKETYEYGTSSFRSKSVTEWIYDTNGRVSKTLSGSLKDDGQTTVSKNCRYSYDGDSSRLTKWECFDGEGSEEGSLTESVEVVFNQTELTRTVTNKRKSYSSDAFLLESVIKEIHADKDFAFPIKSTRESYDYDADAKASKLQGEDVSEILFENNKFSGLLQSRSDVINGEKKKDSQLKCSFESRRLSCVASFFNSKEEMYLSGDANLYPAHIKYRPSDLLVCTSPLSCNLTDQIALSDLKFFGLLSGYTLLGVDGTKDSQGEAPFKRQERSVKFGASLRPWMIENPPEYSSYSIDAVGNHDEERSTAIESNDGRTITTVEQKREKSGEVKTRDELGDFKNYRKSSTICE